MLWQIPSEYSQYSWSIVKKDIKWNWGDLQQKAFAQSKDMLTSSALLVHYDPSKSLLLLQYGVRGLLSQVWNDDEKPVAYASRTLTNAERNYSQLEKEGLALIFGVKKFYNLVEHLPCVQIRSRYKPSSMTQNQLHQLTYKDGNLHLLPMNTLSNTRVGQLTVMLMP